MTSLPSCPWIGAKAGSLLPPFACCAAAEPNSNELPPSARNSRLEIGPAVFRIVVPLFRSAPAPPRRKAARSSRRLHPFTPLSPPVRAQRSGYAAAGARSRSCIRRRLPGSAERADQRDRRRQAPAAQVEHGALALQHGGLPDDHVQVRDRARLVLQRHDVERSARRG